MATQQQGTVIGVFHDHEKAREAIRALKNAGFREDQIGVASSNGEGLRAVKGDDAGDTSYAGEGAVAGVATGAGIGALWGLGILAGALPAIGPAIAGGTLAVILSSAAAGAAAAGLAGALVGMGMSKEEAEFYESELKSGRTIVTVAAGARRNDALAVLQQHGAYDMTNRGTTANTSTARTAEIPHSTHSMAATSKEMDPNCTTNQPARTMSGEKNTVQAREERLNVQKSTDTGEVKIRKEVTTEHKTVDVPVTREEVVIEHHPVSGQRADSGDFSTGSQEIRIPVKEEHVHVEKEAVVTDEVSIGKRKVQGTERVDETLRKEKIKVEKQGDVNIRDERNK